MLNSDQILYESITSLQNLHELSDDPRFALFLSFRLALRFLCLSFFSRLLLLRYLSELEELEFELEPSSELELFSEFET